MLPSALKSIYQQYKVDTDLVATWLATTAKTHGYGGDGATSVGPNNPRAKSGRKKGKARKQGKAPPIRPGWGLESASETKIERRGYVLAIKDFEPMAAHIAKAAGVKIPEHFAVALERVIWARNAFSQRLDSRGTSVDMEIDGRHQFFVGTLEKVRDLLRPSMEAGTFNIDQLEKVASMKITSTNPFQNMFAALGVYEPSESFLNAPDVVFPITEYTAEPERSAGAAVFALATLLHDYERLRAEIALLWAQYRAGELDLAAVSVATNTAFELARAIEEDIKPVLDDEGGAVVLVNRYFKALCDRSGIKAEEKQQTKDAYNLMAYDLARPCLMNVLCLLTGYRNANSPDDVVTNYNGLFGWYDEALGGGGETNRQKASQDNTALMEMLGDLQFMVSRLGRGLVEDELIRGLDAMMSGPSDKIPLWFVWAAQIYLDILQGLGKDCDRGLREMQQEALYVKKAMLDVPASSPERTRVLRTASRWDTDPIKKTRDGLVAMGALPSRSKTFPEFQFLRRHPMHCGLWIHYMRSEFHQHGTMYAATPGAIMCTTQMYHALRQEALLPDGAAWDDLETFWAMQGNATFFVGDPPTDREGYFKNYCVCLGTSISNWAPGKRTKAKVNVNNSNRPNMRFKARVSLELSNRLWPAGARLPLSSDLVGGILDAVRLNSCRDGKGHIRGDMKDKAREEANPTRLAPASLIRNLAIAVHTEVPDIRFDCLAMHNACWDLLRRMKDEFTQLVGPEILRYVPNEGSLPFVVGFVFSTAAGRMGLDKRVDAKTLLLDATSKLVCDFLAEGRGRVVRDAVMAGTSAEEVAGIKFDNDDAWGVDRLMSGINALRGPADEQCPIQ